MRVALTGGTGFLGGHSAERLVAAGHDLVCLVRPASARAHLDGLGVTQVPGTLGDPDALARLVADADAIVHAAGVTAAHRLAEYERTNAAGTAALAAALEAHAPGAAFVLVSSLAAKGPSPADAPVPAGAAPSPVSDYGRSKLAAERIAAALGSKRSVTIVRPPALYGPRDRAFLPLLRLARRGLWPGILPAGAQTSMLYGPDCAELVAALVREPPPLGAARLVEPADGPAHSVAALRAAIRAATGVRRLRSLPVPAAVVSGVAHLLSLAARMTGMRAAALTPDKTREMRAGNWIADTTSLDGIAWSPRTPLVEGWRATHEWYTGEGWL